MIVIVKLRGRSKYRCDERCGILVSHCFQDIVRKFGRVTASHLEGQTSRVVVSMYTMGGGGESGKVANEASRKVQSILLE